jgi:DNA-3-methyladenine glycosylase II
MLIHTKLASGFGHSAVLMRSSPDFHRELTHCHEDCFYLRPVPPFRLDLTIWALRRRKENSCDAWADGVYQRILKINGEPMLVQVKQITSPRHPELEVRLKGSGSLDRHAITPIVERMLGLKMNLTRFYHSSLTDSNAGLLFKRFKGLKPPRFPSLFEALVNGICCQQLSLTVGIILMSRVVQRYGSGMENELLKAFPEPGSLAKAGILELRKLGFSGQKARALLELSNEFAKRPASYEDLEKLDNKSAVAQLMRYRGVGPWTADYVLLRGLGRLDTFPGNDSGARNGLKKQLGITRALSYRQVKSLVSRWHPYEGFVYFHFLMDKLREEGFVEATQ